MVKTTLLYKYSSSKRAHLLKCRREAPFKTYALDSTTLVEPSF